jgi:predicted N-formylglutamate amidohydrolase
MEHAATLLAGRGPAVLTADHAGLDLPAPWAWPAADRWLVGTHWSFDLGVEDLATELQQATGWPAVLSRFTRLLADPNRPLDHPDLFRTTAEGRPIHLNAGLSDVERQRRIDRLWQPYHDAVDRTVAAAPGAAVVSLHSFTPVYEGRRRALELGVLFDEDEDLARSLGTGLSESGWTVALNEPYSGKEGLMYGAQRPARAHGRPAVEVEVRQDLLLDPDTRARLVEDLHRALVMLLS